MSDIQEAAAQPADENDAQQVGNTVDEALQIVAQDAQAVIVEADALENLTLSFQADVEAWQAQIAQNQAMQAQAVQNQQPQASGAPSITPEQLQALKQKIAAAAPATDDAADDASEDASDDAPRQSPAKGGGKGASPKPSN